MITLNSLPKIKSRGKKRVGRGIGSGKGGHTVGRGQKGQKVRGKIHPLFEGTKVKKSLIQRLPLIRGKGRLKAYQKPIEINVGKLQALSENSSVDVDMLVKKGLVDKKAKKYGIKILGEGKLTKKLTVQLLASAKAKATIEAAGGEVKA